MHGHGVGIEVDLELLAPAQPDLDVNWHISTFDPNIKSMSTLHLSSLFALYKLTPGRHIFALRGVIKRATAHDQKQIVAHAEVAIEANREALEFDATRRQAQPKLPVREADNEVDRILGAIDGLVGHWGRKDTLAVELRGQLFPISLAHHTRLPWVDQSAANERVLDILEKGPYGAWLDSRGVRPLALELRVNHDEFEALLSAPNAAGVSWEAVKASRLRGRERYLEVVGQIIAASIGKPELLAELMAPILDQDAQIQAYRQKRRVPQEVDPETGEVPDEAEDEAAPKVDAEPSDGATLADEAAPIDA